MSERTTIGGTVYESIGSSSSNLLLRCNGTAKIQWGNKLIDLIKNGKLAIESSSINIISDESEIKKDGIYIVNKETSCQLWVCLKGEHYNLIGGDLYISANTKQDITVDQQKQVLQNILVYFNTIDEVIQSGINNGLIYIEETKNFYLLKEGKVELIQTSFIADSVEQIKTQEDLNSKTNTIFTKGMIIMHLNTEPVPEGWAVCNGAIQTYKGNQVKTPLLESINDSTIFIMKL